MKATSSVFTVLSIAGLALMAGACGNGNNSTPPPPAAGISAIGTCVYTQVGMLPQGTCPAGQGQVVVAGAGYPAGQCIPSTGVANTGAYPYNTNGVNTGAYPYNSGMNPGMNPGYGGQNLGLGGAQCAGQPGMIGQPGMNGINNGMCVQTQFGCLQQCPTQVGALLYEGNCAPYSYFGVQGNVGMPYGYGPYAPGYMSGGGGSFGYYYGVL